MSTNKIIGVALSSHPDFPAFLHNIGNLGYTLRIVMPKEEREDLDMLIIWSNGSYQNAVSKSEVPNPGLIDTFVEEFAITESVNYYTDIPILCLDTACLYMRSVFGGYVVAPEMVGKPIKIVIEDPLVVEKITIQSIQRTQILIPSEDCYKFAVSENNQSIGIIKGSNYALQLRVEEMYFLNEILYHFFPLEEVLKSPPPPPQILIPIPKS